MQQHDVDDTTTKESSDRGKAHRIHLSVKKLRMTFGSRPPHRSTILKDWENKSIVATKQQRGVHKDMLHQPQNTNSLRETGDNTTYMVFEGEPAVKLHAKNAEVGTSANGNPRPEKVTMESIHSPGSTNH